MVFFMFIRISVNENTNNRQNSAFQDAKFQNSVSFAKKTTKDESTPKMEICSNGMDRNLSNHHSRTIVSWKAHQTLAFAIDYVNYDFDFSANNGICVIAVIKKSFG